MYNELYEFWKHELENNELEKLPPDFYSRVADYLRKIREESRMLDKRTVKANLLKSQMRNVKQMFHELIHVRYRKLVKMAEEGKSAPPDLLTVEEEKIYTEILPLMETFQNFAKDLVRGRPAASSLKQEHKRTTLRFLKEVPAIIGSDMRTYGPFKVEDVASLPVENAKILFKQALAEKVIVG